MLTSKGCVLTSKEVCQRPRVCANVQGGVLYFVFCGKSCTLFFMPFVVLLLLSSYVPTPKRYGRELADYKWPTINGEHSNENKISCGNIGEYFFFGSIGGSDYLQHMPPRK